MQHFSKKREGSEKKPREAELLAPAIADMVMRSIPVVPLSSTIEQCESYPQRAE